MPPWVITAVSQALKPGLGRQILGRVGLHPARLARVVQGGRLEHHQIGRLQLHPAFRERVLDSLVLADGPAEHDALLGVARRASQCGAADANGFGGDQDALRVHAVQDVLEALAFFADAVLQRAPAGHRRTAGWNSTALRPILSITRASM